MNSYPVGSSRSDSMNTNTFTRTQVKFMHHFQRGGNRDRATPKKLTDCSTDEWRGVTNVIETFLFDEVRNCRWEVLVVCLNIVL